MAGQYSSGDCVSLIQRNESTQGFSKLKLYTFGKLTSKPSILIRQFHQGWWPAQLWKRMVWIWRKQKDPVHISLMLFNDLDHHWILIVKVPLKQCFIACKNSSRWSVASKTLDSISIHIQNTSKYLQSPICVHYCLFISLSHSFKEAVDPDFDLSVFRNEKSTLWSISLITFGTDQLSWVRFNSN